MVGDLVVDAWAVAFLGLEGVLGRFLDPFAAAVSARGKECVEEVGGEVPMCGGECCGVVCDLVGD
jgi:hypothetical protein